ncbi:MAG: type IV pilus secretin PilQ [Gammaproteobacteria bacterium]|nr:type IV pilus secretin PilQ [Gammaproteobacteria bacterium]
MKFMNLPMRGVHDGDGLGRYAGNWILAALVCLLALPAVAQESAQLEDIKVVTLPGQQVQLELLLSGDVPEPLSFTINDPARIALDLPGTSLNMDRRRTNVGIGALNSVVTAEAGGRTRVVLNLDSLVPYETRISGNSIIVLLGVVDGASRSSGFAGVSASAGRATSASSGIERIDFRRSPDGAGRIMVTLSDPNTSIDLRQQGNLVLVDFQNTSLPDRLLRRMDVMDFATPVSSVDTLRVGNDTRLIIAAQGDFEEVAYQSDNVFTVEISKVAEKDDAFRPELEKEYVGERMSLNFQDIETRAVLQLLADTSDLNMVVSDTVQGSVTLRLQNVPWDQALDIVLRTKGLDMREQGNVILIAPADEIAARERQELETYAQRQELEPLRAEFVQVNYAKASDLAALMTSSAENALLSERGSVAVDQRTNTLLVQDTEERLADIRRMVAILDIPIRQVLIEARIVTVNDDYSKELGVRFGVTYVDDYGSGGLITTTGGALGIGTIVDSALDNIQTTGQPFPVEAPSIIERYNVNLPVANPAGRIALAILDNDYIVDLELSALQAEGRGEIISTPRVVTANQKQASILQGVEIPYQESSSSGATTTQFKDAVLRLLVTPQITPDDRIIMDLQVNQDTVGESVASATGGFVPSIDTREIITQVLVNDGETVVLGGIYETETREVVNQVPVLGDIPIIGRLFKSTVEVSNKSELLIFITPKILRDGSSAY